MHGSLPARTAEVWTTRGALAGNPRVQSLVLRPERGVELPAVLLPPPGKPRAGIVYVSDAGRRSAVHAVALAEAGYLVLAVDLLGLGETTPTKRYRFGLGRPGALFMQDFFGVACLNVLGTSLYAQRVAHLRWVARELAARHHLPVGVVGQGTACGVYALTALALDPGLAGAAAVDPLRSFGDEIRHARFPAPGLVAYGILRAADVPTLIALGAPRPVTLLGGRASNGALVLGLREFDLTEARGCYRLLGRPDALHLGSLLASPRAALLRWAGQLRSLRATAPAQ